MADDSHGMGIPLPADSTPIHQYPKVAREMGEKVAAILAGGMTEAARAVVIGQVAQAVANKIATEDLLAGDDPRLPVQAESDDVFFAVTDEDGRRTWLESTRAGTPTARVLKMILGSLGIVPDSEPADDVFFAVTDEDGRRTWLESTRAGTPPQRTVDAIAARLRLAGLPAALITDLAAAAAALVNAGEVGAAGDSGYDVFLLAGQSNMSGRGTPYDQRTDPPHSAVWQWGSSGTYAGRISQAVEPLAMVDTPSGIGPGLTFARWYAGIAPGRQILLVSAAQGGQSLVEGTWDPDTPGSNASNSIARANEAMAYAGAGAKFAGILWVQGESDGDRNITGAAYATKFDKLARRWRSEITGAAQAPIVLGGMVPEYLGTGTRQQIATIHQNTPSRLTYTAYAPGPAGAHLGDGNHYNAEGARLLGRALFEAYKIARTRAKTI